MKFVVRVAGRESPVDIEKRDGLYEIQLNGRKFSVDSRNFGDTELFSLLVDGKSFLVDSAPVRRKRHRSTPAPTSCALPCPDSSCTSTRWPANT